MNEIFKRTFGFLAYGIVAMYTGAKLVLDFLLLPGEIATVLESMPMWLEWLFSTPWWVPSLLLAVFTAFGIWLLVPDKSLDGGTF